MSEPLSSDGVVALRAWRAKDVPALVAACSDSEIVRWARVPPDCTEEDIRIFLATQSARQSRGEEYHFAVVEAPDGALLGAASVRPGRDARAALGYFVAAPNRRRGVAVRAVRLCAKWAFEDLAVERLEIVTQPENEPSQRVAERAGFTREGLLRSYLDDGGRRADAVMFSLLPGE